MRQRIRSERGQTATEYMLVISVICIALISGAYVFVPQFRSGVQTLAQDVKEMLDSGSYGEVKGIDREGGGGGGGSAAGPSGGMMGGAAG